MALNHQWWETHFKQYFVPQLHSLVEVLEHRLLPTFTDIESEANEKAEREWERLGSLPARDDIDMSDLAEKAFQTGLAHYEMMTDLRQGLQNMFATALFHLYEQQVMFFHRRELLHPSEENDPKLFNPSVFRERLQKYGIDITKFQCWLDLEELRLLANTVKHAEGDSAKKLHTLRPDLFERPSFGLSLLGKRSSPPRVYSPLMGEDVYVSVQDLRRFANSVEQFWKELSDAMARV
jgi:hypothetical protein